MSNNGAYPDEMSEINLFTDALRAAVPSRPDPEVERLLVPRLAATARTSTIEAETVVMRRGAAPVAGVGARPRSRRALLARVGIAIALVPLVLAGLAFAGVTVPSPARDAFDSVGITLPNQRSDHSQKPATTTSTPADHQAAGNEVSSAAHAKSKGKSGNSDAAHEHARKQHQKAKGEAKGHDHGKAVGLNESTPPGTSADPARTGEDPSRTGEADPVRADEDPARPGEDPARAGEGPSGTLEVGSQ